MSDAYRVAVVGATGAVGQTMLEILRAREFPTSEVVAFASERSAGRELDGVGTVRALSDEAIEGFDVALFSAGRELDGVGTVRSLSDDAIEGFDVALFSAGSSISREWAPRFAAAGALVIDNSSCWRMDPDVPLVVSEVNPAALDSAPRGIIANPNCTTMQMVVALKPIHDAARLERVILSSYQATSGTGVAAVQELQSQAHALLHETEPEPPTVYPHRIAFNIVPQVETFNDGDDYTTEERKVMHETRKILGEPELRVTATCVRVPVVTGHSESVNIQTASDLSPERCRELLAGAPGIVVVDEPAAGKYPMPADAAGRDEVFVGRIRRDASNERSLNLWIVGDNLRKGAALNAVQIAELLHARGLLGARSAA